MSDHPSIIPVEASATAWDAFVHQAPEASFCHLSAWREIMTDVLGHECRYAAAIDDDGQWCGVLPMVRVRSQLFGRYLISMPFLNYGGPVGSPGAQERLGRPCGIVCGSSRR